jgi:hypothetical protein
MCEHIIHGLPPGGKKVIIVRNSIVNRNANSQTVPGLDNNINIIDAAINLAPDLFSCNSDFL